MLRRRIRSKETVSELGKGSQEQGARLLAVEAGQKSTDQKLGRLGQTLSVLVGKLSGPDTPRGHKRGRRARADRPPTEADTEGFVDVIENKPCGPKFPQLLVTKEMHDAHAQCMGLDLMTHLSTDVNPGWDADPSESIPGDEWWVLVGDALASLPLGKQRAPEKLNIAGKMKNTRNKLTFLQALLDESLTAGFEPVT